jgi:hypothetical protein
MPAIAVSLLRSGIFFGTRRRNPPMTAALTKKVKKLDSCGKKIL